MNQKSLYNYFILCLILLLTTSGCKEQANNEKKEKESQHSEIVKRKSSEQRYANHVAEIHKTLLYKEEAFVGFELDIQLPDFQDQVKIIKATNYSEIQFSSKKYGDLFYMGSEFFSANEVSIKAKEAKVYLDMAFIFGAFSQIFNEENNYLEKQEKEALATNFKVLTINQINSDFQYAPNEVKSWTDARTDMLKAIEMSFSLTEKQQLVYFNRYITVNRIPVSLTWNFFDTNKTENLDQAIGEVKIARIKYYKKGEYSMNFPEELNQIELTELVQ